MSDLAHHQTEEVQLIFLGMGKSDIMHTDHTTKKYLKEYIALRNVLYRLVCKYTINVIQFSVWIF